MCIVKTVIEMNYFVYCIREKQYSNRKYDECAVCFFVYENGCKLCGLENPAIAHIFKHPYEDGIKKLLFAGVVIRII